MIKSSANKVASFLYYNDYIDKEKYEYEVYLYGFESLIALTLNLVSILLIGLLFNRFMHTVVFLACYCPLRKFTGGYSDDTYKKCFLKSLVVFIITILIANDLANIDIKPLIVLFSALNWISIYMLSPVDDINHTLTDTEKIKYKKNARLIAILVFLFTFVSEKYFIYSALSLFWINIFLNISIIKTGGK